MASLASYAQEYKETSTFGTPYIETIIASELYEQNSIICGGLYQSSFQHGEFTAPFNGGNADAYFAKFDEKGEVEMMKFFGGWADETVADLVSDNEGNIYLTGYFQGNDKGGTPFDADPNEGFFPLNQPGALLTRDCFIIKLNAQGEFVWAKQISNTEYASQEDSKTITVDNQGGVYIGGSFAQADFNTGGDTVPNIVLTKSGKAEGFLVKLDAETGNFVWLNHWYGGPTSFEKLVVDSANGSLVALGMYTRTMHPGTDSIEFNGPIRDSRGFLARISLDGELEWVKDFGGEGKIISDELLLLSDGNLVAAGRFSKTATFQPQDTTNEVTAVGAYDLWWSGFDANGEFLYNKTFGGKGIESIGSLQEDKNGNLLIAALFSDTSTFTSSTENLELISKGGNDIVLLNMSQTGDCLGHLTIGGDDNHGTIQAFINDNDDVIMTGNFIGTVDFNPYEGEDFHSSLGSYDNFITRFTWPQLTTGIFSYQEQLDFAVYPNPAESILNVRGEALERFEIYALNGRLIKSGSINLGGIHLDELNAGSYLFKVYTTEGLSASKLILKQ